MVSLCIPSCPGTCSVKFQAGLKCTRIQRPTNYFKASTTTTFFQKSTKAMFTAEVHYLKLDGTSSAVTRGARVRRHFLSFLNYYFTLCMGILPACMSAPHVCLVPRVGHQVPWDCLYRWFSWAVLVLGMELHSIGPLQLQ